MSDEIVLVPMTKKMCEEMEGMFDHFYDFDDYDTLGLVRETIEDCLEGKEGLSREEIESIHSHLMELRSEYISMFWDERCAEEYNKLIKEIEKLKRWIE